MYTIAPSFVFITYPTLSGRECVKLIGKTDTSPKLIFLCAEISIKLFATTLCSCNNLFIDSAVNLVANILILGSSLTISLSAPICSL